MRRVFGWLSKLALKALALLAIFETALASAVSAIDSSKRWGQPRGDFPREERPELAVGDSRLKLYTDYETLYEAMLAEIEQAESHVFVETFIWQDDEVGRRFVETLARKAREGVRVYAIFDGLANLGQPESFKRFPEEIHALHFRPFTGPVRATDPRNALRDHRKILAVDGRVAFVGGFNIGSLYTRWRDSHLRIAGPEASEVESAFAEFWNLHREGDLPELGPVRERNWDPTLILHCNNPSLGAFPIRDMLLRNIDRAQECIYLTTAYLILGPRFRARLINAVQRGADVQILFPERSNHALVDRLARHHFTELLRAGVRIFAYDERFMVHAKTVTIDGVWSTIGSANIDSLSLFALYENNLEVHDARFAGQLEATFELDKTNAEEITLEEWESRPLSDKLIERALSPLRPLG